MGQGVRRRRHEEAARQPDLSYGIPATSLGYDGNGNVVSRGAQTLTYTPFEKVRSIQGPDASLTFQYDASGQRIVRQDATDGTTVFTLDGMYESRPDGNGASTERFTLPTPSGSAVRIERLVTTGNLFIEETNYVHSTLLGSGSVISEPGGTATAEVAFDPWGQARDATNWTHPVNEPTLVELGTGFTGHPAQRDAGLINMGGRMYDPALGRFVQRDPIVANAINGADYNKYTYVRNQPFRYTDPSGYAPEPDGDCGKSPDGCGPDGDDDGGTTGGEGSGPIGDDDDGTTGGPGHVPHDPPVPTNDNGTGTSGGDPDYEDDDDTGGPSWFDRLRPYADFEVPAPQDLVLTGIQAGVGGMFGWLAAKTAVGSVTWVTAESGEWAVDRTLAKAREIISGLPDRLFERFSCTDCAEQIVAALKEKGISGEILNITANGKWELIVNDLVGPGTNITENGFHQAVRVGGQVFDNFFPGGVSSEVFEQSLHAPAGVTIETTPF